MGGGVGVRAGAAAAAGEVVTAAVAEREEVAKEEANAVVREVALKAVTAVVAPSRSRRPSCARRLERSRWSCRRCTAAP